MILKCIAIDDEPLALRLIGEYVSRFPKLQLIKTFEDAISAAEFLKNTAVDLLFLDINMPDISGIDLLRSLPVKPMVIFTTSYRNYAYEGFQLEAVDFVEKPIEFERFTRAIEKALAFYQYKNRANEKLNTADESLYVHSEYRIVKIDLSAIEYIESMENYIRIHLTNDKPVFTLMTLKEVLKKLPADKFQRIHRSYIVPVSKIKSIQNRKAQLTDIELPVSDAYYESIRGLVN
ncbi:LytTR family DNA-binding domain-containing protein [Mucilaginibacter sp. KACC 22773]|jgi:DNA-binding LytR/AlgR family response regulator|uniref:LytR/AlgR family response regulator transcription factor n=1 Tax=Mucilaginibacter sp. KACC 22773 TaxID=3025671 RepID=UPI002366FD9F|nr:LytTR family DNA-binding domain-containing protein [Mucilaginibacter sp. KACC 22773]WDF75961.1 LytTR family DNA-binding domain-containing protein [Mucilaginibacter sp. KACC 22773]